MTAMKAIHHDEIWVQQKCRQHGRNCLLMVSSRDHDRQHHFKLRENKPATNTPAPPCIGCRGKQVKGKGKG